MYQAMKRHSLLAVLPRLIPALALALALLILTGGSVVNMILGPENLNTLGDNVKVGDYVEFDMSQLISPYATYSNTESGEVYDAYYIVKIAEGTYLSLHTGGDQMDSLERATDQAYDYYMNNSGILNPMGMISGEIRTLDGEQQTLLLEWLTGSRVEGFESGEESTGTAMALDVDLGKLGGMTYLWNWILFALGLAALAYAVVLLWQVFSGSFYRQVTQELGDSADAAQDWQTPNPSATPGWAGIISGTPGARAAMCSPSTAWCGYTSSLTPGCWASSSGRCPSSPTTGAITSCACRRTASANN